MTENNETKALKIDKQILDKFWTLSESSSAEIIKATDQLVVLLKIKQKRNTETELSEELEYSVKRLVKGLASSRETARQGFSVALCQILRKFDVVTVEEFLNLISKHLKLPKKESKAEKGSSFLGESLAYLTLIQSGRLLQGDGQFIKKVIRGLLWVSEKRVYLKQICYNGICLIVQQISSEDFEQYAWPEIEPELKTGWEGCSADVFSLLITCRKHHSELVNKQFLKEHWKTKKLFKEDHFTKLWNILMEGTSCDPVIHHINKIIVQELVHNKCSLGQFWQAGQGIVFGKSQVKLLNLGFHMLLELLPLVKTADEMRQLLSRETVKTWVKNVDGKLRDLNPLLTVTKTLGSEFVNVMKSCDNSDIQIAIMKCIVQTQGFPGNQTTKTLDSLVLQLSAEAAKDYGNYLMQTLIQQIRSVDPRPIGMMTSLHMLIHLRTLVTLSSTAADHKWQLQLLEFLMLHSYWKVIKESKAIKHCNHKCDEMPDKIRKQFQDSLHKSLTQLITFKTENSKSLSVHAYKDTIYLLATYVQTLLDDKTNTVALVKPMRDQARADWDTVFKHLKEIHSKEDTAVNHAFELLFLFNAIQIFTDGSTDNSGLEDLIVCYKKASEKKRKSVSKTPKREPAWIEVLTELLLSMMSQGSTFARMVANNVFACMANHITPEAMSLITEVLKVEKPGEDNSLLDIEDDEEDMEEMESDAEEEEEDKETEEVEESASDEDTDSSEEEKDEVDEEFRAAIKSALGPAAVEEGDEGDEEEEDEDMSDSEMFKLDTALAMVFKNSKRNKEKEKKETQKQLDSFKLRVLDLVEALVKTQLSRDLVLDLLFPLLELMMHGEKVKENRELSNKATGVFKQLYKRQKVHGSVTVGTDRCLESLKSVIEMSKKVIDKSLLQSLSDAFFLVVKQEDSSVNKEQEHERLHKEVIRILAEELEICLTKKNSKINMAFFTNIVSKAPAIYWPLAKTLFKILKGDDPKGFFKIQACSMLAVIINKTVQDSLEETEWDNFTTESIQTIEYIFKNMTETQWSSDDDWEEIMTAIELDVTGADQPEEAVSIDNTNSVNLMEQTVSTKVKFNQKTDVSVKPDNESTSQQADVTVNPDNESTSQQTDVTVNPDIKSTSQKTDVTVNPDTESASQQADVTVNPYTESTSQLADVTFNPDIESTSQHADVNFNPDTETTSQQADVAVNPDTESTSQQADVTADTFNPEYDSRSKETVVTNELLHQDDSIIQVIHNITTINPNDNSTTRQVDITDFTVEHNNTFTTGLADVNNITDQPDDQSTNEQLDAPNIRVNPNDDHTSQYADVSYVKCNHVEGSLQQANITNGKVNLDDNSTSQQVEVTYVTVIPDDFSNRHQADVTDLTASYDNSYVPQQCTSETNFSIQKRRHKWKKKIKWLKMRWLRFEKKDPDHISFKHKFDDSFRKMRVTEKTRKGRPVNVMEIPKRYTVKQTVSAAKKKDLLNLCKTGVIPSEYHSFYKGLPSDNKTPDILPDPDFEEDEIDSEKE
ncbi:POL5 [Mytilus coruscus]|uniref:POL5 n=1 Tax=Mytilus coruscus TaxID=42192 RepID=A0A6J7ZZW9_MYTCO|nr:POL5 [Mytilus coruscus]